MKFVINSKTLSKSLEKVVKNINKSPVYLILENVLLEVKDGRLTLTATQVYGGYCSISSNLQVDVEREGDICVPAKQLLKTLKSISDQPITIVEHERSLKILSGNGKYAIAGEDATDFTDVPDLGQEIVDFSLGVTETKKCLTALLPNVSKETLKPNLQGIHLKKDGEVFRMQATNNKTFLSEVLGIKTSPSFDVIVPTHCANLLKQILPTKSDFDISFTLYKDHIRIFHDGFSIISYLIDDDFLDLNDCIPTNFETVLEVSKSELETRLKRLMVVDKNFSVTSVQDNVLSLSSENLAEKIKGKELLCTNTSKLKLSYSEIFIKGLLSALGLFKSCDKLRFKFEQLSEVGQDGYLIIEDAKNIISDNNSFILIKFTKS